MKSRISIKTRLLALALTVLMTVGVLPFSVFAVGNDKTDNTLETDNTLFRAPTGEEIEKALGDDGKLLYYNDYNSLSGFNDSSLNASAYKNIGFGNSLNSQPGQIIDDGNGGKALHLHNNGSFPTNYNVYVSSAFRNVTPEYQGKGFVVSADFKMNGAIMAGSLIALTTYMKYNTGLTSLPVWVDTDGTLWVSDPDKLTPNGGSITGGLVYEVNKIDNGGLTNNGGGKKGTMIGKLSSDEYTNIAVQVKDNKLSVYVNGECKVSDLLFMSDSAKEYFAANKDTAYGDNNEFALGAISFGWRGANSSAATHNVVQDNVTVYVSDEFVSVFGKSYDSNLTAKDFAADPSKYYKSESKYWKNAGINGMTVEKDKVYNNGSFYRKSILDGGATGQDQAGDYKALSWAKGYAGADLALTFELQAQADATDCMFQMRVYPGGDNGVWGRNFLKVKKTDSGGYELWISTDVNADGYKIADVPTVATGKYMKIQALFDFGGVGENGFEASTMYIYVDGELAGSCEWGTSVATSLYATQSEWGAEAGDNAMPMGIMIGGITLQEGSNKYNVKNLAMYYYDEDGDGDVADTERKVNVIAPTLLHYNNFNNATSIPDKGIFGSSLALGNNFAGVLRTGGGEALVDDGRGGKALTYKKADSFPNGFQGYYQVNGINDGGTATANSGKSFVVSADFKLTSTHVDTDILGACAWGANTANYGRDLNVQFVYARTDGGIYVSRKSDDTSKGVFVNEYRGGWQNGELIKIGSLSTSHFTNIAVAVNVAANTFRVYVNGVDATGDLQFLTDSDKAQLDASEAYPNGFGYSYTRINFSNANSTTSDSGIILDNVAAYLYGDIVKKNNNPLNGYIKDGDKYYYYNNGNIATNFTSADGLLSAGLDGVVKHGVEALANINSIYKYVGTDVIPVDGVFSGVYSYTKSKTTYCFDTTKSLIRSVTVYDAVTAGTETDTKKAVGFSISDNGVATPLNGYYEVADGESYFYVNGVRTKGMVEINGDIFYIADDYSMFAGYQTVNGKTYFFDATANNTGSLVNGVHTADGVNAKFYDEGVPQTGLITTGTTKYFADSEGKLLTGIQYDPVSEKQYFFFESGENKYQAAAGASVLWNGTIITVGEDGTIDAIGGRVYGEWSCVDGNWYYSDASGNITTGFAYIDKSPEGENGGYYYFDENGEFVKETFVEVYGTLMYFHTDGKAPTGVIFVSYNATNFPQTAAAYSTEGEHGVDGEYMNFVNGVLPSGVTEVIYDNSLYKFVNGRLDSKKELNPDNPEILIHVKKDGRQDTLTFNSNDNKKFDILLAQYPCYKVTVYDVTNGKVEVTANEVIDGEASGRYTLEGTHTYNVIYEELDHEFGSEPVRTVDATCATDGYREYKCEHCYATTRETIEATGEHVYNDADVIVIKAPECNKTGAGIIYCANGCGCGKKVDIPATGKHNWVLKEQVDSTCVKQGYKYYECSYECCHEHKTEVLPFADHEYGAWTVTTPATCVTGGVETRTCIHEGCTAKQERATAKNYDNHYHGSISRYDDENIEYYEYIKTDVYSTCLVNGKATYRCKDCGGFIYDVVIALDPDNHHYNNDEEYLAVLDYDGKVIETVKIIDGIVYRNGEAVGEYSSENTKREVMLSFSNKICGGSTAEWRIDCKNGCINPDDPRTEEVGDAITYYEVVEKVEGTFLHSFDLETLYTTTDRTDELYGKHYYKCSKCGKPAGAVEHDMVYVDNGDGTHNHVCSKGCIDEATNEAYGEFNVEHTYEEKYNATHHWTECVCGAKTEEVEHTLSNGYDDTHHWTKCDECGYINKTEHIWTDVPEKASTCTEKGYSAHQICECGAKKNYTEYTLAEHNISNEYKSDENGHWYECTECHGVYGYHAHNYVTVPKLDATCVNKGHNEHRMCYDCNYLNGYEEEPALGHDVEGQPYNYDDVNHWQICKRCSATVSEAHDLAKFLSDEEGTMQCTKCNHIVTDITLTWWYKLGLSRTTVDVDGVNYYRYTYSDTKNALVYLGTDATAGWYYFDGDGYLVLIGDADKGVNNANVKENNGTFDSITAMSNTRGIVTDAIITTANGIFYIKDGVMQYGWQEINAKFYFFNTKLGDEKVVDGEELGALVKPADGTYTITALNYTNDAKILVNVDADGARRLGVVDNGDGSASYYLDGIAGKLTGRIEDNYYNIGKLYFADAEGKLYGGTWTSVNGIYYSFANTEDEYPYSMVTWHMNATTTLVIDGVDTIIYTDGEGRRIITGWYLNHGVGGRYIIDGVMQTASDITNYIVIDDTYYTLDTEGIASYYTGWNNEGTLYVSSGIIVKNRFENIGGKEYYFDCDGQIVKAASGEKVKVFIGSWVYSIDDTGAAVQYVVGGENPATWVYFVKDGKVDTTEKGYYTSTGLITSQAYVIDTFTYIFDANGRLVTSKDNYECNGVVYVIDADGKATVKDDEGEDAE